MAVFTLTGVTVDVGVTGAGVLAITPALVVMQARDKIPNAHKTALFIGD